MMPSMMDNRFRLPFTSLENERSAGETNPKTEGFCLFVGSLREDTSEDEIAEYFGRFGLVLKVNLIMDWVTSKSKRCAIVSFEDKKTLAKVLKIHRHVISEKPVRCTRADQTRKGTKIISTKRLFIGNVPSTFNEVMVRDFFS